MESFFFLLRTDAGPLVCAAEKPRPLPLTPKLSLKPPPPARTCITTAATAGQGSPPVSRQTSSRAINRISQQSVSPMSRTRLLCTWRSPVVAEAVVCLYMHTRGKYVCTSRVILHTDTSVQAPVARRGRSMGVVWFDYYPSSHPHSSVWSPPVASSCYDWARNPRLYRRDV